MSKFVIQYASNLFVHNNQNLKQSKYLLKTGICSNLALLGNIGNPQVSKTKDFILWCSDNWKNVYYVPGPTELVHATSLTELRDGFPNFPKNVHILDQSEKLISPKISLIGCPLWSGWANEIQKVSQWSEEEKFFMANRTPNHIRHWHNEDVEFIAQKLRDNDIFFPKSRNTILLTHNLFDAYMMTPGLEGHDGRNILIHDGRIRDLITLNLKGILCGAGGGSHQGRHGTAKSYVNCAFRGPNMVPNPMYRRDAIASFDVDEFWTGPYYQFIRNYSMKNLSKYLPKPDIVGLHYANPNMQ